MTQYTLAHLYLQRSLPLMAIFRCKFLTFPLCLAIANPQKFFLHNIGVDKREKANKNKTKNEL